MNSYIVKLVKQYGKLGFWHILFLKHTQKNTKFTKYKTFKPKNQPL